MIIVAGLRRGAAGGHEQRLAPGRLEAARYGSEIYKKECTRLAGD